MPQAYQKCAISFGLVYIPVSLYSAAQDNSLSFNQLHKDDLSRVKYKKVCSECGRELTQDEIVKGYEYEKGSYVVMEKSDFEKAKTENDRSLSIQQFSDVSSIEPMYFEKSYYAVPQPGGEKAFELLRESMASQGKAAIAKAVFGEKEALYCLIAHEYGISATEMRFIEEVRPPIAYKATETTQAEKSLAQTLVSAMDKPFDPSEYHDEYQLRLRAVIDEKVMGKPSGSEAKPVKQEKIIDLMEALRLSVESAKPQKKTAKRRTG